MTAKLKQKQLTLVFLEKDGQILLGAKKRGFGSGRWNGFGGKVEEGESIEEAARREVQEECGIICGSIEKRGLLSFVFIDEKPDMQVHVFHCKDFTGVPIETDEMQPSWFPVQSLPYRDMWSDDIYWLPQFLSGNQIVGEFTFESMELGREKISHWNVKSVDQLPKFC